MQMQRPGQGQAQCCLANQEYSCIECGAAMTVTHAPEKDVDYMTHATPQCFHCGAAMQRTPEDRRASQ